MRQAFIAPRVRRWRVSARVSMPCTPGIFQWRRYVVERRFVPPVARDLAQFLDDKPAHMRRAALRVGSVRPVVADERISHGDDLPAIGGIGKHFLVAGHGSVEANLADCSLPVAPKDSPSKIRPSSRARSARMPAAESGCSASANCRIRLAPNKSARIRRLIRALKLLPRRCRLGGFPVPFW